MSENQIEIIGNRDVELLEKNRQINLQKLFTPEGMDAIIATIKKEVADFEADVSTKEGRARIITMAAKVARCKSPIKELATELKEDSRKFIDGVNSQLKRYEIEMDTLRDEIRKPVDEIEEKEAAELKDRQDKLARIEAIKLEAHSPTWEFSVIERFYLMRKKELCDLVEFDWKDFDFKAKGSISDALQIMSDRLAAADKSEADRIELEKLKKEKAERDKKDREDQIAKDAAEKAKRDAEEELRRADQAKKDAEERAANAERLRKEQEELAEKNRIAAEKRAKEDAEKAAADAVAKERERVKKLEFERLEQEAKREANKRHRNRINGEIIKWIKPIIENESNAQHAAEVIVEQMAKGEVPHVQINY